MYCKNCGTEITADAKFCKHCGTALSPENLCDSAPVLPEAESSAQTAEAKKSNPAAILALGAAALIVIIGLIIFFAASAASRCKAENCSGKKSGGDYCVAHTCVTDGCVRARSYGNYCISHVCIYGSCTSPRSYGEIYCSYHLRQTSQSSTPSYSSSGNAQRDLSFTNIEIEHNSSYTVVTGKVRNNGSRTYRFVQIKGAFKNSYGTTVDTDWTYAVGSEGLAPGESTSFRMSVSKDYSIRNCSITITDYD